MKRKDFIQKTMSGVMATITGLYVIDGCSSSEEAPQPVASCQENGAKHSSISLNHGHTLVIPKDDVIQGVPKSYLITGAANHAHEIQLTSDDFQMLKNNQQVSVVSSVNADHTHQIVIKCA